MNPTPSDVHVNRPLTSMSVAMIQASTNFIASQVFQNLPVAKQSDAYFSYDNAYWNKDEMRERAPSTESAGNGYKVDGSNTYTCVPYAFHKDIDDDTRSNADDPINLDREAMAYVTLKALLKREALFVTNFFSGSVWTYDYDGVSSSPTTNQVLQWNDAASTPIEDISNAQQYVLGLTGFEPRTLVLGYPVYKTLLNHPDIIGRVNQGQTPGNAAVANQQQLARIFDVDEVLVSRAVKNTAAEGDTATHSAIVGKKAGLFYKPATPGLMTPAAGYTFAWTGRMGTGPEGNRIKKLRMDHLNSDRIEIEMALSLKKVSADLGAFWDSVIA